MLHVELERVETKHKHAELFEAIANGELADNFECQFRDWQPGDWYSPMHRMDNIFASPEAWTVRRKPRTIRIGELEVPEPMRVAPAEGTEFWLVATLDDRPVKTTWRSLFTELGWLKHGVCHLTKEAAETHRKALILVSGGTP